MFTRILGMLMVVTSALALLYGCGETPVGAPRVAAEAANSTPSFSLAWSEYPSWSAFGVADQAGLINGKKGQLGPIETKWNVDIELKEAEYDPCLTMYGAGQCDAVCITNIDALNPSLSVSSVAILPTSTSCGGDALIVSGAIRQVRQLKGVPVYGLAKTCSEYCFSRNLEVLGEKEADYCFKNMDPAAAALAMQQKQSGFDAIVVWNPFVLETLNKRSDAHVLFDSSKIPNEIIDMVVVSQNALDREGGGAFACALVDAYYALNRRLADPATADQTLVALGEKFSHLDLQSMKKVVQQTLFFDTPEKGREVLTGSMTKSIMVRVVKYCVSHQIVASQPRVGYGNASSTPNVHFRLDPTYIEQVQTQQK